MTLSSEQSPQLIMSKVVAQGVESFVHGRQRFWIRGATPQGPRSRHQGWLGGGLGFVM